METIDVTLKIPQPGTNTVYLFNVISSETALETVKKIQNTSKKMKYFEDANIEKIEKFFSAEVNVKRPVVRRPIEIVLNTSGGYCYDGFSICNTISEIDRSERPVHIHASGLVASMGIAVLMSVPLEKRTASRNTTFMIHQVSGFALGKTADVETELVEMKRIQSMIWKIIAENSKITEEQLSDCYEYKKDWYISAEEALELGLISQII